MSIDGDEKHSKTPFSTQKIRSEPSTAPSKTNPQVKNSVAQSWIVRSPHSSAFLCR
jgi:hypothetical protein